MYRKDYARAGFKMLTVVDSTGKRTTRHIMIFTIALVPMTLLTTFFGITGVLYSAAALILGTIFLICVVLMILSDDKTQNVNASARRVFFASLLYLPTLMIVMSIDKV
jgi:protoheme IX farnesyltransferase